MPIWRGQHEVWTNYGHIHEADERDREAVIYEYCVPGPFVRGLYTVGYRLRNLPSWIRNIPNWIRVHARS